jgi:hypothetical protein
MAQTPDAAVVRLNRLLNLVLEAAVEALEFDAATVTARNADGSLATVAATDKLMISLDDAQYESGQGPCLATLDQTDPVYLDDAGQADERWPLFAQTASHLGVHSSLSMPVPADRDVLTASLNMYSRRPLALTEPQIATATRFTEQVSATLVSVDALRATEKLARELTEAMRSRAAIEQAKGMLMAEMRIDADQAFDMLTRLSQGSNVKLRDVARRIVEDRSTPEAP